MTEHMLPLLAIALAKSHEFCLIRASVISCEDSTADAEYQTWEGYQERNI